MQFKSTKLVKASTPVKLEIAVGEGKEVLFTCNFFTANASENCICPSLLVSTSPSKTPSLLKSAQLVPVNLALKLASGMFTTAVGSTTLMVKLVTVKQPVSSF